MLLIRENATIFCLFLIYLEYNLQSIHLQLSVISQLYVYMCRHLSSHETGLMPSRYSGLMVGNCLGISYTVQYCNGNIILYMRTGTRPIMRMTLLSKLKLNQRILSNSISNSTPYRVRSIRPFKI